MSFLKKSLVVALFVAVIGSVNTALAWSPVGTPERAAEEEAASKMRRDYPAYRVMDVQIRSNRLSISIPTRNAIGRQVNFSCPVEKRQRRDGSIYYAVGNPQPVQ